MPRNDPKGSVRLEYLPGTWYSDANGVLHEVDFRSAYGEALCGVSTPAFVGYVRLTKVVGEPDAQRSWCPECVRLRETNDMLPLKI